VSPPAGENRLMHRPGGSNRVGLFLGLLLSGDTKPTRSNRSRSPMLSLPGKSSQPILREESRTEFMTPHKREPGSNPSEQNQQEPCVIFKLLHFLLVLAASLVELVFRADQNVNSPVLRQGSEVSPGHPFVRCRHATRFCRVATSLARVAQNRNTCITGE
jgi:hypothetical protein